MAKTVVITGQRSGIGKAIKEDLENRQYEVIGVGGDVSKRSAWESCAEAIDNKVIWAVVNCAGIAEAKSIFQIDEGAFRAMFEVNCLSIFHSIQVFGRKMIQDTSFESKSLRSTNILGHIVNVTSISSLMGMSGHAHYCASKFAANGLMQVAAKELSKSGILVNNVCPGPTETPLWDKLDKEYSAMNGWESGKPWDNKYFGKQLIKRLGNPKDTAAVVRFLISEDNTYITGTNTKVCGGNLIG